MALVPPSALSRWVNEWDRLTPEAHRLLAAVVEAVNGIVAPTGTDLTYTAATRVLASSTGADVTLPLATSADAGLLPATGGSAGAYLRGDVAFSADVRPSGSLGYASGLGAGGAVTQATSKGTAVTINKVTGQITTHTSSVAAGGTATFDVNNSTVASTDVVHCAVSSSGSYTVAVSRVLSGLFTVRLTNTTGGILSEAVVINFVVLKGATT